LNLPAHHALPAELLQLGFLLGRQDLFDVILNPLTTILRIHCMQQWHNLRSPAMEVALYEIASRRLFPGLSLDKTLAEHSRILKIRLLPEQHCLARQIFFEVKQWLPEAVVLLKRGYLSMSGAVFDRLI
jgi:hypothetical protein